MEGSTVILALCQTMLDSVIPPACVLCGELQSQTGFCKQCRAAMLHSWPANACACRFCGMPRPQEPVPPYEQRCLQCERKTYVFDEVIVLGIYQEAIREAVIAAKLARYSPLAKALGELLGESVCLRFENSMPDRVVFVPSHFSRRVKRQGMGCTATIAAAVARRLGKTSESLLRVTRPVRKQSLLTDAERPANVRGAFAVKKSYTLAASPELRDQHILLIDDVLTTGSTASEISKVLKEAGAERVTLAVVARSVRR